LFAHGFSVVLTFFLFSVRSAELKGIDCDSTTTSRTGSSCFPNNQCPCFIPAKFRAYFPADVNFILHIFTDPKRFFLKLMQESLQLRRRETLKYQDFIDELENSYHQMIDRLARNWYRSRYDRRKSASRDEEGKRELMKELDKYVFNLEHRSNVFNLDGTNWYFDIVMFRKNSLPDDSLHMIEKIVGYELMKEFAELFETAKQKNVTPLFDLIRDSILCGLKVDISKHAPFVEKLMEMVTEFLHKVEATTDRDEYLHMLNQTQLVSVSEFFLSEEMLSYAKSRIKTSLEPWLMANRQQIEEEAKHLWDAIAEMTHALYTLESPLPLFLNIQIRQLIDWLRTDRFTEDVFRHWLIQLPTVPDSLVSEIEAFAADPKTETLDKLSEYYDNFLREEFKLKLAGLVWRIRDLMPTPSCVTDLEKQSPQKAVQVFGMDLQYADYLVLFITYIPFKYLGII